MAPSYVRALTAVVFGVGLWVILVAHTLVSGRPMKAPEWEFAVETFAFSALAAAVGLAIVGCRSVRGALCAVPLAFLLTLLIPRSLGIWLSQSFESVAVNLAVLGLLFAIAGAGASWLIACFFKSKTGHA